MSLPGVPFHQDLSLPAPACGEDPSSEYQGKTSAAAERVKLDFDLSKFSLIG